MRQNSIAYPDSSKNENVIQKRKKQGSVKNQFVLKTVTGPLKIGEVPARAFPIRFAFQILRDYALKILNPNEQVANQMVENTPARHRYRMYNFYYGLITGQISKSAPLARYRAFLELCRFIEVHDDVTGIEGVFASLLQSVWHEADFNFIHRSAILWNNLVRKGRYIQKYPVSILDARLSIIRKFKKGELAQIKLDRTILLEREDFEKVKQLARTVPVSVSLIDLSYFGISSDIGIGITDISDIDWSPLHSKKRKKWLNGGINILMDGEDLTSKIIQGKPFVASPEGSGTGWIEAGKSIIETGADMIELGASMTVVSGGAAAAIGGALIDIGVSMVVVGSAEVGVGVVLNVTDDTDTTQEEGSDGPKPEDGGAPGGADPADEGSGGSDGDVQPGEEEESHSPGAYIEIISNSQLTDNEVADENGSVDPNHFKPKVFVPTPSPEPLNFILDPYSGKIVTFQQIYSNEFEETILYGVGIKSLFSDLDKNHRLIN